ncbi:MAG TPA: GDYXXLXY domain-containing protein [Patescibacteria group bacterium]|nr:GDYXXLXY domain-containing protein [Patescibacteria group bacterium]
MKNSKVVRGIFIMLALLQLSVPLYMAWRWEDILQTGTAYQWRTAPVDPNDALRGRYIDLRFKETKGPVKSSDEIHQGQTVYALLGKDGDGFAYITGIGPQPPAAGDYVEARAGYKTGGGLWSITLPFKRFYLREDLAPEAEKAYQRSADKGGKVTVKIKNGMGVIEQLYIGEQSIEDYLRGR